MNYVNLGVMAHIYNPSHSGDGGKKIMVLGQPAGKCETHLKNKLKPKVVAQVIEEVCLKS
jgi:hypothetical protein